MIGFAASAGPSSRQPESLQSTMAIVGCDAFAAAGCDELIFFPCDPDPEQVDLLADALR